MKISSAYLNEIFSKYKAVTMLFVKETSHMSRKIR